MSSARVVNGDAEWRRMRRKRAAARGFSLVELMAVVLIMGILATLGITVFRERARDSNVANAVTVIKLINASQEAYRAQNQVYLNVSSSPTAWYPRADIRGNQRASFWRTGADADTTAWRRLAPEIRQPVQFGFLANAGLPNVAPTSYLSAEFTGKLELPTGVGATNEPWYLTQARSDADADSIPCGIIAASWSPEIRSFNDGE